MRRLYLAPFFCPRGTETLVRAALETGAEISEILYLTPSPRKLRAARRLFLHLSGRRALIPPELSTPRQFALHLNERFGERCELPDSLKPLLVRKILKRKKDRVSPGYAQVVAGFISDIKRYVAPAEHPGLPELFKTTLAGYEKTIELLLEAWATMQEYNEQLAAHRWADTEDLLSTAPGFIAQLPRIKVLLLDSFVAPNRLEKGLLAALIDHSDHTFALGFGGAEHPAYNLPGVFVDFIAGYPGFQTERLDGGEVRRGLKVVRFPTPEEEITAICHRLRAQAQTHGLENTYLVFPRLAEYAGLVTRTFAEFKIPFTIFPETPLAASPLVSTVLELLEALDSDYERVATAAAFSSRFFPGLLRLPDDADREARRYAALALNSVSRRAGIIKGRKNWEHIAERVLRIEGREPDDPEAGFLKDIQRRVRQALGLTEKILEREDSLGNQARRLKQFLETVECGKDLDPEDEDAQELRADQRRLYDLLDTLVTFEEGFGAQMENRSNFISILKRLLSSDLRTPEKEKGGVTVIGMEESLGINPDHLYFAGLTEDTLPGAYTPGSLLPERLKKMLGIPDIDWHRDLQRFHFHRTLGSTPNEPFLTCPATRAGNPVLPTPFLQDLAMEIADRTLAEENEIYSDVEWQVHTGRSKGFTLNEWENPADLSNEPAALDRLAHRFAPDTEIAVTALERYRNCPFRFYLEDVLKLNPVTEPEFLLDARQWGVILHDTFSRLYSAGPLKTPEELRCAAERALAGALERAALPRFWSEVTRRVFKNILDRFIEQEMALRRQNRYPLKTEYRLRGTLDREIRVKGRIDRIDSDGTRVFIIDYKTGAGGVSAQDVETGRHLQLPIYAHLLASQEEFAAKPLAGIEVYDLRAVRTRPIARDSELEKLIGKALEHAREAISGIRAGRFCARPADERNCHYCKLNFTCGYRKEAAENEE